MNLRSTITSFITILGTILLVSSCRPAATPTPEKNAAQPAKISDGKSFQRQIRELLPPEKETEDSRLDRAFEAAYQLQEKKDYLGAIAAWQDVLKKFKLDADDREEICFNIAYLYELQYETTANDPGLLKKSIDWYTRSININPNQSAAFYNRGNVYNDLNDHEHALHDYSEAIRLAPQDTDALVNRGQLYYRKEKYDLALPDFNRAIELNPANETALWNRADLYRETRRPELALRDYSAVIKLNPQNADALAARAAIHHQRSDLAAAFKDINAAIELMPENLQFRMLRALVAVENNQANLAVSDLTTVLERDQKDPVPFAMRAQAYTVLKKFVPARQDIDRALQLDFRCIEAHRAAAALAAEQKQFDAAITSYRQCIKLAPRETADYLNLMEIMLISGRSGDFPALREEMHLRIPKSDFDATDLLILDYFNVLYLIVTRQPAEKPFAALLVRRAATASLEWDFSLLDAWLQNPPREFTPDQLKQLRNITERMKK